MFKIKQSISQKTMRWRSGISFGTVSKFKDLNLKMKKKMLKQFVKLTQDAFPSKLYVWKAGSIWSDSSLENYSKCYTWFRNSSQRLTNDLFCC